MPNFGIHAQVNAVQQLITPYAKGIDLVFKPNKKVISEPQRIQQEHAEHSQDRQEHYGQDAPMHNTHPPPVPAFGGHSYGLFFHTVLYGS